MEQQQQQAASLSSDDLSAETFMEQKMDNESDEERDLEAIREQGKVNNSSSSLPVPREIEKDEPEDVKPDINSLNTSNTDATNTERSEDHEHSPSNTTASSNSYNNSHNSFQVPGQQQLYNQQQQSYNSYGSLNTQFYNSMQMQQQLMLQQMHQQQQQQQNVQQQSTSHNNFYGGSESRPDVTSYPQSQAQESQPQKEYKVEMKDVQKLSILTKPELVNICKRNNLSVTGEKQALAARILRKVGKIFDDEEEESGDQQPQNYWTKVLNLLVYINKAV